MNVTSSSEVRQAGWLNRFSITARLLLTVALLCIPYPFLISLLVLEQNRSMDFGRKEILGSDYLNLSTSYMIDLAGADLEGRSRPGIPASFQEFHTDFGSELEVNAAFQKLTRAEEDAFQQSLELNKRVGDYSNLILDPDLDSYYLMDIILLRIPELIRITRDLELARRNERTGDADTQLTLFDATLKNIQDSAATSFEKNSSTRKILEEPLQTFVASAGSYRALDAPGIDQNRRWLESIQAFFEPTNQELRRLLEVRVSAFQTDQYLKLLAIAISLLLAFAVLWLVIRSILRPIRSLETAMKGLSDGEGDLTIRLQEGDGNEIARSSRYFNRFAERLRASMQEIKTIAASTELNGNLSTGTVEIISGGLQDQAASLEQVSAAMEEVSASADRVNQAMDVEKTKLAELMRSLSNLATFNEQIQEHIRQGSGRAQTLAREAKNGTQEMQDASEEMQAIVRTTTEMSGIGGEIQEIAERINLLSLNASIEAARAGEYGRGFAVVASEVSRLADRTNESIGRIARMMNENRTRVQSSTEVIQNAVQRALRLSEGVLEMKSALLKIAEELPAQERIQLEAKADLNMLEEQAQQIYSIVKEQKEAIQEASNSINQINNTAQNHAESARHLADLSSETSRLAAELNHQTSWFKTGIAS